MGQPARDIYSAALALPEAERLELASHLIASVEGPADPNWEEAWIDEIGDREQQSARERGHDGGDPQTPGPAGSPWADVRGRVLDRLTRR